MRRLSLLFLMSSLAGCIDSQPPAFGGEGQRCLVDANCSPGLQCLAERCGPIDTCAAGIYIGDELPTRANDEGAFPVNSLVRQVSGLANGISIDDGELRVVNEGEPRLFEIDFFDDPDKSPSLGLFLETRMRLGPDSAECTAVLSLWVTKTDRIKLCFGGGRIGLARPGGGSTGLVANVPDLTEEHVYRIAFRPIDDVGVDRHLGDGNFVIELFIDDRIAVTGLTLSDLPEPQTNSDRAPLIGFGAEAAGTVSFDYVRWGCDPNGGTCRLDRRDDDECDTDRQNDVGCNGAAVANELCDNLDNDCDGKVDENYTAVFPDGRPIAFDDFGEEVFKGENCGLTGACSAAIVVCDAAGTGLTCDASAVQQVETCDGQDNDCDGLIDEDYGAASLVPEELYTDPVTNVRIPLGDRCGVGACDGGEVTCENLRPICSTESVRQDNEVCGNLVDDDCDGAVDEGFDVDGDGFQNCVRCAAEVCASGAHDCNDTPGRGVAINPGAAELCNQIDDNCNGQIDEGLDLDGDGFLPCARVPDCRDDPSDDVEGEPAAFEVNPDANETCDAADNDCDGRVDEGFTILLPSGSLLYPSRAHCGRCGNDCAAASEYYNTIASCIERPGGGFGCSPGCRPGFLDVDGDVAVAEQFWNAAPPHEVTGCECRLRIDTICDSGDVNRACAEICNGIDDDCDGMIDEVADMDLPGCWDGAPDQRQVGICRDGSLRCIDGRLSEQCFGSRLPEAEQERVCDNRDEDCDGRVDEGNVLAALGGLTRAGDVCNTGLEGVCANGLQTCVASEIRCVATDNPGPEICNGLDDDCDGVFEEDTDADGDGVPLCRPCGNGEAPNAQGFCVLDCDDSAANGREGTAYSPNIEERCTGEDNDCDGRIDETFVLTDELGRPIALNGNPAATPDTLVYNQLQHCGACGVVCARPNSVTHCDRGTCRLASCREGFLDLDNNPDNGCERSDCRADNVGAEAMQLLGTVCSKPMYDNASECACIGTYQCDHRGGVPTVVCAVDPNNPDEGDIVGPEQCLPGRRVNVNVEACNALDDDCDGIVDEGVCP